MKNTLKSAIVKNTFFGLDYLKIDFEWFTTCDRNCSYCYNVENNQKRYSRSTEDIIKILKKIMDIDYPKIVISLLGGEILLSKDFNKIIDFIVDYKKPEHKFLLFTHAQHNPELFKKKMESVLKLKDSVRIIESIHFEDIKKDNFLKNAIYVNKNFKYKSFVIFPTPSLTNNIDFFESLIEKCDKTSIEPLIFDRNGDSTFEMMKQKINVDYLKKVLLKYNNRSEMSFWINDKEFRGIEGKYELFTKYKYKFQNMDCLLRVYEIRENGDMYASCAGNLGLITNINTCSMKELNDKIKIKTIICSYDHCEPNLCALKVTKHETK